MKDGEKYLSIKLVGHDVVKAFRNPDAGKSDKHPTFKGDGVAVWVNTYHAPEPEHKKDDPFELDYAGVKIEKI